MHALSTNMQKPHSNNSSKKTSDELRLSKESGRGHNLWGLYGALDLDICAKFFLSCKANLRRILAMDIPAFATKEDGLKRD